MDTPRAFHRAAGWALAASALLAAGPAPAQRNGVADQARRTCERQVMRDQRADRRDVRIDRTDADGPMLRVQGSVRRDGPDVRYTCSVARRDLGRVAAMDYSGGGGRPDHRPDRPDRDRDRDRDRPIDPGLQQAATGACVDTAAQRSGLPRQDAVVGRVRRQDGLVRVDILFRREMSSDLNVYCYFDDRGRLVRISGV